jgi:hypothetical protein
MCVYLFVQNVLQYYCSEVLSVAVEDACVSPLLWRLTACNAIATILSTVHTHAADTHAATTTTPTASSASASVSGKHTGGADSHSVAALSPIYSNCVQTVIARGQLAHIVNAGIGSVSMSADTQQSNTQELAKYASDRANGLLSATLLLCAEVAMSVAGVHALLQANLLQRLLQLDHLRTHIGVVVNSSGDVANMQAWHAQSQQQEHMLQVLQLLRVMLHTHDNSVEIARGALTFIKHNRHLISHHLKVPSTQAATQHQASFETTVTGLYIKRAIIGVLSVCANVSASTQTPLSTPSSSAGAAIYKPLFDQVLEHLADTFTADICNIVGDIGMCDTFDCVPSLFFVHSPTCICLFVYLLGSAPIPSQMSRSSLLKTWFDRIEPSTEEEYDLSLQLVDMPGVSADTQQSRSALQQPQYQHWTAFDSLKLSAGLDVARVASCFLRIRCEHWLNMQSQSQAQAPQPTQSHLLGMESIGQFIALTGMLSFNVATIVNAFTACLDTHLKQANTSQALMSVDDNNENMSGNIGFGPGSGGGLPAWKKPANSINSSLDWLQAKRQAGGRMSDPSSSALHPAAQSHQSMTTLIAENLICVLHALAITCEHEELKRWRVELLRMEDAATLDRARKHGSGVGGGARGGLQSHGADIARCLLMAEKMPSHCFIRTVARWIRGIIEQ